MRLADTGDAEIENPDGRLTTVTSRICLNMLRRREEPLGPYVPEPIVSSVEARTYASLAPWVRPAGPR